MGGNLGRIRLLAGETFREIAVHNRWFHICAWALLLFVLGGRMLMGLPLGTSAGKLLYDLGQVISVGIGGIILVITLSYHCLNEMEDGVAQLYLVHRVSRTEYLLGKLLGCWVSISLIILLADILLAILVGMEVSDTNSTGIQMTNPGFASWGQLFAWQVAQLLVLASLTLFMISFSNTFLFSALTSLLLWVACHLLSGASDISEFPIGWLGVVVSIISLLIPRFEVWEISNQIWYAGGLPGGEFGMRLLSTLLYAVLFSALAVVCFKRREL